MLEFLVLQSQIKRAQKVIVDLPRQPSMAALDRLQQVLQEGVDSLRAASDVQRYLQSLEPASQEILDRMRSELAAAVDTAARFEIHAKRIAGLTDYLSRVYQGVYTKLLAERKQNEDVKNLLDAGTMVFFWTSQAIFFRKILSDQPVAFSWAQLFPVYQVLCQLAGSQLSLSPVHAPEGPTFYRPLAYLLLLRDALSAEIKPRELLIADELARELLPLVLISRTYHRYTPMVLSPDVSPNPIHLEGWEMSSLDRHALFYGYIELERPLQELEQKLCLQSDLQLAQQKATDALPALRNLKLKWLERAENLQASLAKRHPPVVACFQFLRLRGLLGQKNDRIPKADPLIWTCPVEHHSGTGFELLLDANAAPAQMSGLVGIKIQPASPWRLGIIRRIHTDHDRRQFLAVQMLAHAAEPLRAQSLESGPQGPVRLQVIYVPAAFSIHRTPLILSEQMIPPSTALQINNEANTILQIGAMKERGPDYYVYQSNILETNAQN